LAAFWSLFFGFEHDSQFSGLLRLVRERADGPLVVTETVTIPGTRGAIGVQPIVLRSRTNPNKLVVFLRSRCTPRIQFTLSNDDGTTFEPIRPTIFPNNNSGIGAAFVGRHLVLAFNNCTGRRRVPLTLAVSEDEGETWLRVRDVVDCDAAGEYSYPFVHAVDETRFMLAWTHRRESIAISLFNLEWILRDGRSCSAECAQ
jgi:hypothetical protein